MAANTTIVVAWVDGGGGLWKLLSADGELFGIADTMDGEVGGESARTGYRRFSTLSAAADAIEADFRACPVPLPR